jgi:hypothetical protein
MSSYKEAFTTIKSVNKKPIIQENERKIPDSMQLSQDNTTTTFNQPNSIPSGVIQDNRVQFDLKNNHSWSNVRGFGNINVGTYDSCNNIHGRVHPYNRIKKKNIKNTE